MIKPVETYASLDRKGVVHVQPCGCTVGIRRSEKLAQMLSQFSKKKKPLKTIHRIIIKNEIAQKRLGLTD
jgi:hypothetical protein